MAGIRVLTDEEVRSTPGQPSFHVVIFLYKPEVDPREIPPFYAKAITAHLYQSVRLARTSSTAVHRAITWESALIVGIQPADSLKAGIRTDVNDRVDELINAYLAVNQPKSASGNPAR
jgi:hypothetical protein